MVDKPPPRIAVIAVHGVADQKKHDTAHKAAALLLSEHLPAKYQAFTEKQIHIGLEQVKLEKTIELDKERLFKWPVQTGSVSYCITHQQPLVHIKPDWMASYQVDKQDIEHESMREQLQEHVADAADSSYQSIVLEGKRQARIAGQPEPVVDVYENYWADLSRMKNGFFTLFFEFYLFLFFFSRLGGMAAERAIAHYPENRVWKWLNRFHRIAEFALVIVVPVTHLALLTLAASGAPFLIEKLLGPAALPVVFKLLLVIICFSILAYFIYQRSQKVQIINTWPWLYLGAVLITATILELTQAIADDYRALILLIWLVFAFAVLNLFYIYNQRRPGAFLVSCIVMFVTGFTYMVYMLSADGNSIQSIFHEGVLATKNLIWMNVAAWLVFANFTLAASITGFIAIWKNDKDSKTEAKKTAWTEALSLILPGALIMLITFMLWQAQLSLSDKYIGNGVFDPLQQLIDDWIYPHLWLGLLLMGLGLLFAIWMVIPAAISEMRIKKGKAVSARWVGEILSQAISKMRLVGELLRFLLLVGAQIELYFLLNDDPQTYLHLNQRLILYGGLAILIMMFGSKGAFSFLSVGFRSALDIALDVLNWLRFRPRAKNPRAAICRRYVSLLRHIAQWKDPETGRGYDGIVIVSHSQGTVITADLLRFLNREYRHPETQQEDRELAGCFTDKPDIPICLLTFGSPLRQLYNQRFPLQYAWAGKNTNQNTPLPLHGPNPKSLGVSFWSNLYCSGDYIGRYLWYADNDANIWRNRWSTDSPNSLNYRNTREKCIGAGGHTQYWNGLYPEVAEELDTLISALAARKKY